MTLTIPIGRSVVPDEERVMWTALAERSVAEVAESEPVAYLARRSSRAGLSYRRRIMSISPSRAPKRGHETPMDSRRPEYIATERSSRWTPGLSLLEL
jgi:hypothetical protein